MHHALTVALFVFAATFAVAAIVGTVRENWDAIVRALSEGGE